jgi:hypothetical protein
MTGKGWWRVSLKMETLRRLEKVRDRLQTDEETLSIDAVVSHLITAYYKNLRA